MKDVGYCEANTLLHLLLLLLRVCQNGQREWPDEFNTHATLTASSVWCRA